MKGCSTQHNAGENNNIAVGVIDWETGKITTKQMPRNEYERLELTPAQIAQDKLNGIITDLDDIAGRMDALSHNKWITYELQQMLRVYAHFVSSVEDDVSRYVW